MKFLCVVYLRALVIVILTMFSGVNLHGGIHSPSRKLDPENNVQIFLKTCIPKHVIFRQPMLLSVRFRVCGGIRC